MAKNKTNWLLDTALFAGLLSLFWLDLTGVGWHQWLGVGLGVLFAYHLLAHWKWVEAIGQRFFRHVARQPRVYFAIDLALLTGFYLIGLTGLVISTWLELELGNYAAWRELHVWASIGTLVLVVVKIGLHQGWIISTARRYTGRRRDNVTMAWTQPGLEQTQPVRVAACPAAAARRNGRRDFLVLMGVVGAASLLSAFGALHDPAAASKTAEEQVNSLMAIEQSSPGQSESTSSSACTVRCNRRCSYPGHCQRYQDSNGNGRCDLGECA